MPEQDLTAAFYQNISPPVKRPKITLRCPFCKATEQVEPDETDPPGTVEIENGCPACSGGDFDDIHYYDAAGKELAVKIRE